MNKIDPTDYDLDIFCELDIFKLHFATAGGIIPHKTMIDPDHHRFRASLKSKVNTLSFNYKLNPALDQILAIKSEEQRFSFDGENRALYLYDFINYAKKGLFSFDRTFISKPSNSNYHLVAYPILDENYGTFLNRFLNISRSVFDYSNLNSQIDDFVIAYLDKPIKIF